ncbi:MAG: glycosyltransferase [Chloroflexota bacterium]|nr:MAG: glycosyltransferase [Chloroflexota bacterium]
MRILIPNHFPLQGSGSGIYTLNLAKELVSLGHEVLVIVPEHQPIPEDRYPFPVEVILFNNGQNERLAEAAFNFPCFTTHPRSVQTFYDLSDGQLEAYVELWRRHISRAVEDFAPDVVHGHHVWVAPYVATELGLPTVISVHGTDLMGFRDGHRYRPMALAAAERAYGLIAISRQVSADAIATYQVPKEKIHLIWNGFDSGIFKLIPGATRESVPAEFGITSPNGGADRPLVSFVGKFTSFKGIDVLLRAAAIYEQAVPGIRTVLVGHGQLFGQMRSLSDELDLRNVHFLGHQPQPEVARIYNAADVSVVPSRVEPFGLVAVEALACGTPVVATDEGGLPDFINDRVGALVPVDDHAALAEAIIGEVKNGTKATKGAYAAQYAAEGFSWAGQVAKMAALYESAQGYARK